MLEGVGVSAEMRATVGGGGGLRLERLSVTVRVTGWEHCGCCILNVAFLLQNGAFSHSVIYLTHLQL